MSRDNANFGDVWDILQAKEDAIYRRDVLAEYKNMRAPAGEFAPRSCRVCDKRFRSSDEIKAHIG
jgi:hypothetical protein